MNYVLKLIITLAALTLSSCATTPTQSNIWRGNQTVIATGTCKAIDPPRSVSYSLDFEPGGKVTAIQLEKPKHILVGNLVGNQLKLSHTNPTSCPSGRRTPVFETTGSIRGTGSDRVIDLSTDAPLCPDMGCTFKVLTVLRPVK